MIRWSRWRPATCPPAAPLASTPSQHCARNEIRPQEVCTCEIGIEHDALAADFVDELAELINPELVLGFGHSGGRFNLERIEEPKPEKSRIAAGTAATPFF